MSRVGRRPIDIPKGVKIEVADGKFVAEGTYATIGSVSDLELPPSGKKFLTDFSAKFGIAAVKIGRAHV